MGNKRRKKRKLIHLFTAPLTGDFEKTEGKGPFAHAPHDILYNIFRYLSSQDLCIVGRVCRNWRKSSDSKYVWYPLYKRLIGIPLLPTAMEDEQWKTAFLERYDRSKVHRANSLCEQMKNDFVLNRPSKIPFWLTFVEMFKRGVWEPLLQSEVWHSVKRIKPLHIYFRDDGISQFAAPNLVFLSRSQNCAAWRQVLLEVPNREATFKYLSKAAMHLKCWLILDNTVDDEEAMDCIDKLMDCERRDVDIIRIKKAVFFITNSTTTMKHWWMSNIRIHAHDPIRRMIVHIPNNYGSGQWFGLDDYMSFDGRLGR
eukprot:TRINITY_DN2783_c0_g1_i1.p1 TRINITY_DN2783_c0_g1~~TRINITY_DN2783_c0_g1_i1.p1  ORF type:complete len:312 (+),score=73.17 TRINITY_DN2783_c0_g1_i1:706-1641(+)